MKTKALHRLIGTLICLALVFGISLPAKAELTPDLQTAIQAAINDNADDPDAMTAALGAIIEANPDFAADIVDFAMPIISSLPGITPDVVTSIATSIANIAINAGADQAVVVAKIGKTIRNFAANYIFSPPPPAAGGPAAGGPAGGGLPDTGNLQGGRTGSGG